jgi:hypothetical protein
MRTRNDRWIKASFATARFEQFMVPIVQGLGRIDTFLIAEDQHFLANIEVAKTSIDESARLSQRITMSYLWVLGAYELVRTICQKIKSQQASFPKEIVDEFNALKKEFNRLRIPLAKMEPARAHRKTDSHIAYPAINRQKGIAWQVAQDVYITRQELADRLLVALELARTRDQA